MLSLLTVAVAATDFFENGAAQAPSAEQIRNERKVRMIIPQEAPMLGTTTGRVKCPTQFASVPRVDFKAGSTRRVERVVDRRRN
jgi:hypothetical protein